MRPSTLRRLGAALLFVLFLPACTDSSPTAASMQEPGSALPSAHATTSSLSYRGAMAALPDALGRGRIAARDAMARGATPEKAKEAAITVAEATLLRHGVTVRVSHFRVGRGESISQLSADQLRYLHQIKAAVRDLGPGVSVAELERRLGAIESRAQAELNGRDREVVLVAIAGMSTFWRANAAQARLGLLPAFATGDSALFYANGGFTWGGLAGAVAEGIFVGMVSGAVGGGTWAGGSGALAGAIGGGLAGGVAYGMDYLLDLL